MRYSLIVYNNYNKRAKNIYEINLESILGSNYKLKDILTFTSNFKNDEELIKYLVNKDLLVPELYNGSKIGIGENKEDKLVIRHPYVVYEEYSKYLEPVILKYYYKKGLDNPDFFIPFADKTYYALSHYDTNATVKRQMVNLNLMSKYAEAYKHEFNSFEISKDIENKMNDFYKFYTTNKKGELNFTQYTKLLMNIIEFEEKQNIQKLTNEELL